MRPFFCQVEAVETAIWLTEVAPKNPQFQWARKYLQAANDEANPELFRIALKLATGAGKTTVMAMLIAWQTINANRRPNSKLYSNGFLIVAPGITIRDRLRVLLPNDPESYYLNRELIPEDMRLEIQKARVVITNYHAFQLREKVQISAGGKKLLQGRGPELKTKETESEMVRRVMGDLMGMKNIVVLNDEAHHCYREKAAKDDDFIDDHGYPITGNDLKEAKQTAKKQNQYAKNQGLGLEVPYLLGSDQRRYLPDFLLKVDDGHGPDDPLNLIVEIKGYRGEDAKVKAETMRTYWIPGVNNLKKFGRWAFAEFTEPFSMDSDLSDTIAKAISNSLAKLHDTPTVPLEL